MDLDDAHGQRGAVVEGAQGRLALPQRLFHAPPLGDVRDEADHAGRRPVGIEEEAALVPDRDVAAVPVPDSIVHVECPLGGADALDLRREGLAILGVDQLDPAVEPAGQLLGRIAEDRLAVAAEGHDVRGRIPVVEDLPRGLDGRIIAVGPLDERRLGPLPLGDVEGDAAHGPDAPGGIPHGELDRVERKVPAVGGFDLLLEDEGGRRLDDLSILVPEAACLLRGEFLLRREPDHLLARQPPQLLPGPVDQETAAVDRGGIDGGGRVLEEAGQELLVARVASSDSRNACSARRRSSLSASRAADSSANRAFDVRSSAMAVFSSSEVADPRRGSRRRPPG